jgi:drug/metabolite transporter (DMT)-like permease
MNRTRASRRSLWISWSIWTAGFLAFPIGGYTATALVGRVDSAVPALVGGAITGLIIGAGQALASRKRLDPRTWIPATSIGMGLGLLLGASTVSYDTSLKDLALMGALTGVVLGLAQALALPRHARNRWAWAAAMPALWALGWTVTTLAGINVEEQFTVFGAAGAVTFAALSGLLLHQLMPYGPATGPQPEPTRIHATA